MIRLSLRSRVARAAVMSGVLAAVPAHAQVAAPAPSAPGTKSPQSAAPAAVAALPDARGIIDRHIAAVGGRAAIEARKSSRATGTIAVPSAGVTGTLEVFAARPAKSLQRVSLAGIGDTEEGFDGTIGWSLSPMTGPRVLTGAELEERRDDSDFDADLRNADRYESITTMEKTTFGGRDVYKLRLVRKGGREEFEFYDVASGLRAGSITTTQTPMGPVTSTIAESNYRKFGTILQPTTIKVSAMGFDQVVTITNVEYDNVPADVFTPPAAIKALAK